MQSNVCRDNSSSSQVSTSFPLFLSVNIFAGIDFCIFPLEVQPWLEMEVQPWLEMIWTITVKY